MRPKPSPPPKGRFLGSGTDKSGRDLNVFWATDIFPPNRGFVVHRATAWHEDRRLGFVQATYVDAEVYKRLIPTIWNHMSSFRGVCGLDAGVDPRNLEGDEAAGFRRRMLHYLGLHDRPAPETHAAFEAMAKTTFRYKKALADRKAFLAFQVQKPYVDYADVGQREDSDVFQGDSRGQGVGKILYAATAKALAEMGLPFHGSGIQTEAAQGLWTRMTQMGWTSHHEVNGKPRVRLHADRIPDTVFRLGSPALEGQPSERTCLIEPESAEQVPSESP